MHLQPVQQPAHLAVHCLQRETQLDKDEQDLLFTKQIAALCTQKLFQVTILGILHDDVQLSI
jgi:hypothetical protein